MINYPLPTNNLYKFMALSGLFIVLFILIFPAFCMYQIRQDMFLLEKDLAKLEVSVDIVKQEKETLTLEEKIEYQNKISQVKVQNEYIGELTRDMIVLLIFSSILGLIGTYLTAKGFSLWYTKVQIFEDKILLEKSKK